MNKIAIITDTHWGARADSHIYLDYYKKFYDDVFFPYLDEHKIDTVVHLGDIVDRRKFINYVSLNRMKQDFIDPMRERDIDFHVIVGNHDISYRNSNHINAMDQLFTQDSFPTIYDNPRDMFIKGHNVLMVPWVNSQNLEETLDAIEMTSAKMAFGHLEIQGADWGNGVKSQHGSPAEMFKRFDKVLTGHFHGRSEMGNITYIGNPYHMYWGDYGSKRGFVIMDLDTQDMEYINNPYSIFHKIYYNDENKTLDDIDELCDNIHEGVYVKVIVEMKTNVYWFDKMLNTLYEKNCAGIQIIDSDVLDGSFDADNIDEAEDTLTIVKKYIDNTQPTSVNKKQLMFLFNHLYTEAENMDL